MSITREDKPLQSEALDGAHVTPSHGSALHNRNHDLAVNTRLRAELEDAVTVRFKAEQGPPEPPDEPPSTPKPRSKTDTVNIPNAGRLVAERISRQAETARDEHADFRLWLEGKSKEELVELLIDLDDQHINPESTQEIAKVRSDLPVVAGPQGYQMPDELAFVRLPAARKTSIDQPTPTWWVVLVNLEHHDKPLGLIIEGEITIGRAGSESTPDLDLSSFDAKRKGVSRLHARLRPSMDSLVLIDNDSSNGTFWNRIRLSAQAAQPIRDGDVVAFGRANFLVKVIKAPSLMDTKTLI